MKKLVQVGIWGVARRHFRFARRSALRVLDILHLSISKIQTQFDADFLKKVRIFLKTCEFLFCFGMRWKALPYPHLAAALSPPCRCLIPTLPLAAAAQQLGPEAYAKAQKPDLLFGSLFDRHSAVVVHLRKGYGAKALVRRETLHKGQPAKPLKMFVVLGHF